MFCFSHLPFPRTPPQVVGRLATKLATLVAGKHKPTYLPNVDDGDSVVVLNVDKVKFTGNKWAQKLYRSHSGYPGGLKEVGSSAPRHLCCLPLPPQLPTIK